MNATPERPKGDRSTQPSLSRLARLRKLRQDEEYEPDMPQVAAAYLLDCFFEVGPTSLDGAGSSPLSHRELAAWQENTGHALSAWEVRTLALLSREYLAQLRRSEKADCPAPWQGESTSEQRQLVARDLRQTIKGLIQL